MSKLMEIGRRKHKIKVEGNDLEIRGVSADDLFSLAERFPAFRALLERQIPTAEDILAGGSRLVGAVIASSFGEYGNETEEKHAAQLDLEIQLDMLLHIYDATFPGGVRPFVQRLENKFGIKLQAEVSSQSSSEPQTENSKSSSEVKPNGADQEPVLQMATPKDPSKRGAASV